MAIALAGLAVLVAGAVWRLWVLDRAIVRVCGQQGRAPITIDARMGQFQEDLRRIDDAISELTTTYDLLDRRIAALEPWVRHYANQSRKATR